jgi:hypothetical protein
VRAGVSGVRCGRRWHAPGFCFAGISPSGGEPDTFQRYVKHIMKHGHANKCGDCFFSTAYPYQSAPHTDLPALPPTDGADFTGESVMPLTFFALVQEAI